jgi:hypothetical protein
MEDVIDSELDGIPDSDPLTASWALRFRHTRPRLFHVIQQPPAASHKSRTAEDQVRTALDDPVAALLDGDEALTVQADACCEESEAVFGDPFADAKTDCLVHVGPLAEVETTHCLLTPRRYHESRASG